MENILKQDIFFFITTIAVVILTILAVILIIYLIRISRKVDYIAGKTKNEVDLMSGELLELRRNLRETGFKINHFTKFIKNLTKGRNNGKK
jgi:uncharacterized protein YoxC